jgi:predicted RNase H-like nuclease (RuvC/YqgF family)
MLNAHSRRLIIVAIGCSLAGCASNTEKPAPVEAAAEAPEIVQMPPRSSSDIQKIGELERQLAREQRQCQAEKRRLDLALKDSQKQSEDLQKKFDDLQNKLDALLDIDRELRNRSRNR